MKITIPRKKILYIITKGNFGGAQRYVFDLATHLPQDIFDVIVACGSNGLFTEKLRTMGIRSVLIPSLQRDIGLLKEISALREIMQLLATERPDIIHLNSSKASFLGTIAARLYSFLTPSAYRLKPKIVFTVHGWAFNEQRNIAIRVAIWFISALSTLLATYTIVLSQNDSAQAAYMPFVRRKTRIIPNGIAKEKMLAREVAREQLAKDRCETLPRLWIGTIAELNRNKGIEYLIKAFAGLKSPTTLCIIGDGEEKEKLKALAEKHQIADRTIFAGFKENAAQYLNALNIFALPSLKEGLPYALLEAGAAGLPAIATSVGGIPEIISDMETGILIKPGNVTGISNALNFFIQNPQKIAKFGDRLKKRVAEEFSLSKMVEKTIAVYENNQISKDRTYAVRPLPAPVPCSCSESVPR